LLRDDIVYSERYVAARTKLKGTAADSTTINFN